MRTTTLKFHVAGSDHAELVSKTEKEIEIFLNGEEKQINYEIEVQKTNKEDDSHFYTALVTAKVKNGY